MKAIPVTQRHISFSTTVIFSCSKALRQIHGQVVQKVGNLIHWIKRFNLFPKYSVIGFP